MNRNIKLTCGLLIIAALAFGFLRQTSAQQKEVEKAAQEMSDMKEKMTDKPACCPMKMQECMKQCGQTCQSNSADIDAALAAMNAAEKNVDTDNKAAAKAELAKAKELLAKVQVRIKDQMQMIPAVNARCPIMGGSVPAKLPENQCAMYKGQKIGFCCPACKPAWEKLPKAEKAAKLKAALEAKPEAKTPDEKK